MFIVFLVIRSTLVYLKRSRRAQYRNVINHLPFRLDANLIIMVYFMLIWCSKITELKSIFFAKNFVLGKLIKNKYI